MIELRCPSVTDTRAAAARLASLCRPGDVVLLVGRLGSGKTTFTSGLADGLGIDEQVVSPSFVLMRRYDSGFLPLVHVDVYRLNSVGEFEDLEAFTEGRDGVVVIEWGNAVPGVMPPDRLEVELSAEDDGTRIVRLNAVGEWAGRPLEEVRGT